MSQKTTVSFHLSSDNSGVGSNSQYTLQLQPELSIPHTAKPTVYLHNLLFDNNIANVNGLLYDNDKIIVSFGGVTQTIIVPAGAYSLEALEMYIALKIYDAGIGATSLWGLLDKAVTNGTNPSGTTIPSANRPKGLANPYSVSKSDEFSRDPGEWQQTLNVAQISSLETLLPIGYTGNQFWVKPITLEGDIASNRVEAVTAVQMTVDVGSTLWTKLLGFTDAQATHTSSYTPLIADNPARIDGSRGVCFHCPSLASGTYSTGGKMGGSQLALVPITAGLGEVQSWEASVPVKVPCRAAGSKVGSINFYLANEDGLPIDLLGDRFEAVVVVEF